MIEHLQRRSLIKSSQHGFVRNMFCLTNLLVFMEEVTSYIDRGYPIDVIMAALRSRCGHYIFALWFLSIFYLFFIPGLISAAADWMSTILTHIV